ncbi:SMP-30/gluconolactonase/LRE family protein [Acidisphaera sp. L21]|uniref:SMP-30/gluconolactonase/LRE family protein n=1 Tax=Acidisphaera sp. L21 TaxID=1641851 RepID=UPI001C20BC48|nr:SMP-30/gluconolactonase/LRE family protein [Acidisphaera sp. L21]
MQSDDERLAAVLPLNSKLLLLYEGALHAEGPVWHASQQRLYWSDVSNRRLLAWQPNGEVTVVQDATHFMNGNAIGRDDMLVHCEHGRRCISRSDDSGRTMPIVTHFEGKRLNSPNDLTVASDGTIWFTDPIFGLIMPSQGSLAEPELDHRSVYRFDPATQVLQRMADFEQPNGLGFSPDGQILYVSDTARAMGEIPGAHTGQTHEIQAFDVAKNGNLSNRRFFYHADHGCPDGMAIDQRGWVWATAADGVHIIAPDRTPLGYIPTQSVATNCAFGGNRLFITATDTLLAIDLYDDI